MARNFDNTERRDSGSATGGGVKALSIGLSAAGIAVGLIAGIMSRDEQDPPAVGNLVPPSADTFHVRKGLNGEAPLVGRIRTADLSMRLEQGPDGQKTLITTFSEDFYRRATQDVDTKTVPAPTQRDELGEQLDIYADYARQKKMNADEERLNALRERWAARKRGFKGPRRD